MQYMLRASRHAIIAEAALIRLILAGNGGIEDDDLRAALVACGAPPWVRSMGSLFQWRNATNNCVMVGVAAPYNPAVRMFDVDAGTTPVFVGPLKQITMDESDRKEIWEALFTSSTGAWADEGGVSITLDL